MGTMGGEEFNPREELNRLDEEIQSAADFEALRPVYYRLNEIIRAYPYDFDVQFAGDEVKQRLIARGGLLKQRGTSPPTPAGPAAQPPPRRTFGPGDAVAPREAPAMPEAAPENPPDPPARPPARPRTGRHWNRSVLIVPIAGLLVALVFIFLALRPARKVNPASAGLVQVGIATIPPGASVKVAAQGAAAGGETACTSNCTLPLPPGAYQVSASLDGYDPAAGAVTVTARQPAAVSLTLRPAAQSVRLLTDLEQGTVQVDDGPPVNLQDGQLVLDKAPPGAHALKVAGRNGEASFAFEIADARLPAVTGPVNARNMMALLVASFGNRARVVTNGISRKLQVNGQPQSDASPNGTDVAGFKPGVNEIVVGEGPDRRNMSESFGAAPMLTAFLKTDVNAGTLIVSAGQDDVRVFLNDKEYRRRTERGQVRIQTLGKVAVRVAKSGFQDEPAQTVEVKKGAEVRLQFDLKPQPRFGSLEIRGAMAGSDVLLDQKSAGTVGPDGSFSLGAMQPGDHAIELRHERYVPRRLQRSFVAGQVVTLAAADVVLAPATGVIRLTRNPASATVVYRRGDEAESHEALGDQVELPPGSYRFSASAAGFSASASAVQLAAGENRELSFTLARVPPPVTVGGMAAFEDAGGWKQEGDSWVHQGGGFVPYKLTPNGVFTFTVQLLKGGGVFRAGQIRWCLQYIDSANYLLYEIDRKNFWAGVVEKGKRFQRVNAPHNLGSQKEFTIQIEVSPDRLAQKVRVGGEWKVLDTFVEPGRDFTQGKFGFLIEGNDEIAISDFKFQPK